MVVKLSGRKKEMEEKIQKAIAHEPSDLTP